MLNIVGWSELSDGQKIERLATGMLQLSQRLDGIAQSTNGALNRILEDLQTAGGELARLSREVAELKERQRD